MSNIYAEAITVQDACNLSGVVHSWAEAIDAIWEEEKATHGGTKFVNRHPVNILFASKVASLTGCEFSELFSVAYAECQKKAK